MQETHSPTSRRLLSILARHRPHLEATKWMAGCSFRIADAVVVTESAPTDALAYPSSIAGIEPAPLSPDIKPLSVIRAAAAAHISSASALLPRAAQDTAGAIGVLGKIVRP